MSDVQINYLALNRFLNSPTGPVAEHMRTAGRRVRAAARAIVPVDTQALRDSIGYEVGKDAEGLYALVGSRKPYALRVEMGFMGTDSLGRTYRQAPQPYLRPALRAAGGERVTLTSAQRAVRAGFNERRKRRQGGRTLRADRRQLRRNS